jgi:D123
MTDERLMCFVMADRPKAKVSRAACGHERSIHTAWRRCVSKGNVKLALLSDTVAPSTPNSTAQVTPGCRKNRTITVINYTQPVLTLHPFAVSCCVVLQLNWSAPLDAAWVNGGTLKCHSPGDVIALMKASLFASHDLAHAANTVPSSMAAEGSSDSSSSDSTAASSHSAKCEAAAAGRFVQPDWSSHLASSNSNASTSNSSTTEYCTTATATDNATAGGNDADAVKSTTDNSKVPTAYTSNSNDIAVTDVANGTVVSSKDESDSTAATTESTDISAAAGAVPLCLVLRKWCNFIPSMLFRCFVTQDR